MKPLMTPPLHLLNLEVCKTGALLNLAQVEAIRRLKPHTGYCLQVGGCSKE